LANKKFVIFLCFFQGDWHCAYVLLYGPRKVPKLVTAVAAKAVEEKTATEK
jgi:hypothetical protein